MNISGGTKILSIVSILCAFNHGIQAFYYERETLVRLPEFKGISISNRLSNGQIKLLLNIHNGMQFEDLKEKIENDELHEMGLIIDTFHYFIGEHTINDLDKIEPDKLWLVHINDAIEKPFKELQDSNRVLPCQGFFNLEGFISKLKSIGYDKWISLELFNEQLWQNNPYEVAKNSMDSLKKIIS